MRACMLAWVLELCLSCASCGVCVYNVLQDLLSEEHMLVCLLCRV
jgi:hypothetical protein